MTKHEGAAASTAGETMSIDEYLALSEEKQNVLRERHHEGQIAFFRANVTTPTFYACVRKVIPSSANRPLDFVGHFKNDTDAWVLRSDNEPVEVVAKPPLDLASEQAVTACARSALEGKRVPFGLIGGDDEDFVLNFRVFPYPAD